MKRRFFYLIPIFLVSCSKDNYHNGYYKARVTNPNNIFSSYYEVLKIEGDKITDTKYSIGGDLAGESIINCKQYPDKIEFEENGATKVLRFNDVDSSLKLNDYIVFKYLGNEGEISVIKTEPKPLIKVNDNGTITLLPTEKTTKIKQKVLTEPVIINESESEEKGKKPKAVMNNKNE